MPPKLAKSVTLTNGAKLFYASDESVREELLKVNGAELAAIRRIDGTSDLEAGIYEGGFKVWECALDLCNFLCTFDGVAGADMLELGCGAALPSILALSLGASSVCVQDFNDFVIETFTKRNFELNGVSDQAKCTFVAGEWGEQMLAEIGLRRKFDLILASETIYNESNYGLFLDTASALLAPEGKILLAAKVYYFGVGGSLPAFEQFVHGRGTFGRVEEVWSTKNSSVPRKILSISRK